MTKRLLVLDSWPIMKWLKEREPVTNRFNEVLELASTGDLRLLISTINFGETYYNFSKESREARAEVIRLRFDRLPLQVVHPRAEDVLAAAQVKARYSLPYADSFAMVLALEYKAAVLTGDPDRLRFSGNGVVDIEWWAK